MDEQLRIDIQGMHEEEHGVAIWDHPKDVAPILAAMEKLIAAAAVKHDEPAAGAVAYVVRSVFGPKGAGAKVTKTDCWISLYGAEGWSAIFERGFSESNVFKKWSKCGADDLPKLLRKYLALPDKEETCHWVPAQTSADALCGAVGLGAAEHRHHVRMAAELFVMLSQTVKEAKAVAEQALQVAVAAEAVATKASDDASVAMANWTPERMRVVDRLAAMPPNEFNLLFSPHRSQPYTAAFQTPTPSKLTPATPPRVSSFMGMLTPEANQYGRAGRYQPPGRGAYTPFRGQ